MDVFDAFQTVNYTFLQLAQGGVKGNGVIAETEADGVFKERNGMIQAAANMESIQSSATLHVRPGESFLASVSGNMVGHGIRVSVNGADPQTYRITGQVEGKNFDNGELEFYKVTLQSESLGS